MKILCKWHDDRNPTMHVYADGAYCFACGKQATPQELGMEAHELPPEREPENLEESFAYIDSLPKLNMRGLTFPADEWGYFITWADRSYYKKRLFDETSGRYRSPTGHEYPPFWVRQEGHNSLLIVEGEINALSVGEVSHGLADVVSPGGAGNFSGKLARKVLTSYCTYSNIFILCDEDAAGAKAAISLYSQLVSKGRTVRMKLMQPDANDLLCSTNGKERLKEEIQEELRISLEESTKDGNLSLRRV